MIDLKTMSVERFAKVFDMAILAPETQEEAIREGCRQAREYNTILQPFIQRHAGRASLQKRLKAAM